MNRNAVIIPRSYLGLLVLCFSLADIGCGGGSYSPPPPPPGPSGLSSLQGSWELQFHSDVTSDDYTVLEVNLSQAGSKVFAGDPSALVYQGNAFQISIPVTSLGGKCASRGADQVTLDGMLTDQQAATETITFTLTENGAAGTAVLSASASTNGSSILDGTYTIPAACGFPADQGTFGGYRDTVASANGAYSGTLNSGADVIVANFSYTANSFDLSVSGTDNGAQFVLTGSTVGFSLVLTGNVGSHAVNWFGLYDPTYNVFRIYDSNGQFLGALH